MKTLTALSIVVALLWSGCMGPQEARHVAPAYSATKLGGGEASLAELRGSVVMLNLWATWCHPCRQEMPALQGLQDEFGAEGLVVVGVTKDSEALTDARIQESLDAVGVNYTIWRDPRDTFTPTFQAEATPFTVLIDREGYIVHTWPEAFKPGSNDTKALVRGALA